VKFLLAIAFGVVLLSARRGERRSREPVQYLGGWEAAGPTLKGDRHGDCCGSIAVLN